VGARFGAQAIPEGLVLVDAECESCNQAPHLNFHPTLCILC
jgi:hypothetical protein